MTNLLKALLIDPEKKELSFVEVPYEKEGTLRGFYDTIGCGLVDIVQIDKHPDGTRAIMVIDDEGLLRPNYHFGFMLSNMANVPFSGKCVILEETPDGDFKSLPYNEKEEETRFLDTVRKVIIWYGDDKELNIAIAERKVARPSTYVGSFDKKEPPELVWQWTPHNIN